jgi:UPF0755 protein
METTEFSKKPWHIRNREPIGKWVANLDFRDALCDFPSHGRIHNLMSTESKRRLGFLLGGGALLLCGVAFFLLVAASLLIPAERDGVRRSFVVPRGATLRQVLNRLEEEKIVDGTLGLLLWGKLMGYGAHIKAGEYELSSGMPPIQILDTLLKGEIRTHKVTIPEGLTIDQIGTVLGQNGLADRDEFIALAKAPDIVRKYGLSGPSLEGFLYPDTYRFSRGLPPDAIIDTMVGRFREVVAPLGDKIKASGMSLPEVITLASVVEKETGLPEERPLIAGVFLNRLKRGMRLESDPTVIYGIEDFDGNLTRKDLETPTPYNTYIIHGLPPWPIANPGKAAIEAVLEPTKSNYLFFVSKNNGSHHFSKRLKDHHRAVRQYQKSARQHQ